MFTTEEMNPTFIFIDGSYFTFYRYFSLLNWWKNAHPEKTIDEPIGNEEFVGKFRKLFVETIQQLPKKLKIDKSIKPITIVGKDCPRETIWRMANFKDYKANRTYDNGFMGAPFFKMVYAEELFQKGGAETILKYPTLEADDCIAISVKYILAKYETCTIYIITSDKDYLQLIEPRVKIFDLKFNNLAEQKSCTGNAEKDLFCKIVMGDSSDNIPSVIKKCGPKTALKCYDDSNYFEERLKKENAYELYERNKKLVDFNCIPQELIDGFINEIILKKLR